MKTLGLIGAGNIGSALARRAVDAGYDVVISNSRGPESLAEFVATLGPKARAGTVEEAARAGDLVVITIPLKNYRSVPAEPLQGKIVIDTNNYYPGRDGQIARLESEETTVSELLQEHLPGAKVVKAFNTIYFEHIKTQGQPPGTKNRRALPIAGNDAEARHVVAGLIETFGFDVVDVGPLAEGWRFQRDTPAYNKALGIAETKEALGQARRYSEMGNG